jgi:hypothetical protein
MGSTHCLCTRRRRGQADGYTALRHMRSLLVLLLATLFAGCYATQHVPLREKASLDHATGVRKLSGEEIEFAVSGATIANDTLHAVGKHASIAIPTDSIAKIAVRKFSIRYTAGLVGSVGAVAFLVWLALAFENLGSND